MGPVCEARAGPTAGIDVTCGECGDQQPEGRFCGRCGALLPEAPVATDDPSPRPAEQLAVADTGSDAGPGSSTARRSALVGLLVVAVGVLALAQLTGRDVDAPAAVGGAAATEDPDPVDPSRQVVPDEPPLEEHVTDTVLLFGTGEDRGVAYDLGTQEDRVVPLRGNRPGDQPFRLHVAGDDVIVGWGEVWAVPLDGSEARPLAEATLFVPDADPDRIWLVDHVGGRVGPDAPTWTLLHVSGEVLHEAEGVAGAHAVRGVPGGLAVRAESGQLQRYDLRTGEVTDDVGEPGAHLADATSERLVWCEAGCQQLHVVDAGRALVATVADDDVARYEPDAVWLSPDGSWVAAAAWVRTAAGRSERVLTIAEVAPDRGGGGRIPLSPGPLYGAWDRDGTSFHYRGRSSRGPSYLGATTFTPSFTRQTRTWDDDTGLPVGDFVALPRDLVDGLFGAGDPLPAW